MGLGCRAPVCDDGDLGMSAPVAQGCGHLPAAGLHAPREVSGKTSPTISGLPRHPEWVSGRSHVASARVEPLAGPGPWDRCPPLRPAETTGSAASLHQSSGVLLGRAFPAAAGGSGGRVRVTAVSVEGCAADRGRVLSRSSLAVGQWKDKYLFREQTASPGAARPGGDGSGCCAAGVGRAAPWPRPMQAARAVELPWG